MVVGLVLVCVVGNQFPRCSFFFFLFNIYFCDFKKMGERERKKRVIKFFNEFVNNNNINNNINKNL